MLAKELRKIASSMSTLYVEDDEESRSITTKILEMFFKNVHVAKNGKEGLELYKSYSPDLIVTDLTMPVMDGLEMLREILRINPLTSFVITSAHNDAERLAQTLELDPDGFLFKPVDKQKILETLYRVTSKMNRFKVERNLQESDFDDGAVFAAMVRDYDKFVDTFGRKEADEIMRILKQKISDFLEIYDGIQINGSLIFMFPEENLEILYTKFKNCYEIYKNTSIELDKGRVYQLQVSVQAFEGKKRELYDMSGHFLESKINDSDGFRILDLHDHKISYQDHLLWLENLMNSYWENGIKVHYQTMYDLYSNKVNGMEAYMRIHFENIWVEPFRYLELMKRSGIAKQLTLDVIKKVFSNINIKNIPVFINIGDGLSEEYIAKICQLSDEYDIDRAQIIFDINQDISLESNNAQIQHMITLKKMGFKLCIEQFDNTLIHFKTLQLLAPEYIKLDINLNSDPVFLKSIISFATSAGIEAVATKIENSSELESAKSIGFPHGMGFYLSTPKELEELIDA